MNLVEYSFSKSILNNSSEALDNLAPATFLVWFNQKTTTTLNLDIIFEQYKSYVIAWGKKKKQTKEQTQQTVRDSYIQVLRELVITYSTEEERRFVTNANLTNPSDLDIILPFFISKIKQVCLFYANKREEVKTAAIQHNIRGTNRGIERLIKKIIFDAAQTDQVVYTSAPCEFPPVSALARDLSVYVEELYDLEDHYFNIATDTVISKDSTSMRATMSSANVNVVDSKLYLDIKLAIIDAIKQYPFFIQSLGTNNFTINPVLSGTELHYLKNRDFITYVSGGVADLKINLLKRLAPKYLGNDFYYLSTGSTVTDYVSGVLFSTQSLSGATTLNLLNRQYPSTATVPSLESLYIEQEIGRFFLPQHQGVLIHNTPRKYFAVDTDQLKPNTVYAFPDPKIIGNVSFNSDSDNVLVPFVYTVDVSWNKRTRSDQYAFGDVFATNYAPLYYGYQSREQDVDISVAGISKTYDNVQFWEGLAQEKWADSDIWPDLRTGDYLPIDQRQASIMATDMTPVYWGNDIYGNEYGLLKRVNALKAISGVAYDGSIILNSETVAASPKTKIDYKTVFEKRYKVPGTLYFRDISTDTVTPGSAALSAVLYKYPQNVRDEINSSLTYFAIYQDIFVMETETYVIMDTIIYDYDTKKILINNNSGTYIRKFNLDKNLERFAGEWFSEADQELYLCFLVLRPHLSASNYRALYPLIYKTKLDLLKLLQVYPDPASDLNQIYSLSSGFIDPPQIDLFKIDGISFSRLDKTNLFNITYLAKNLNSIPHFINEQIVKQDPYYITYTPELFKPFYFTYDNNYANPLLPFFVKYRGSISGVMGANKYREGVFDTGEQDSNYVTYLFHDGITPVQINYVGNYVIQFDWESYVETTVFIGCSGFRVRRVENDLVWAADTSQAKLLDGYGVSVLGAADYFTVSGVPTFFNVSVRRPTYPDPSVVEINMTGTLNAPTGPICDPSDAIYKRIEIVKTGPGRGIVLSDPFCINCTISSFRCSESFGRGTEVSLIASGNYLSYFDRWEGTECSYAGNSDCLFTVTTDQSITAVFSLLPYYIVSVTTPASRVRSQDSKIDITQPVIGEGFLYLANSIVTLSTVAPISGWEYRGWIGTFRSTESNIVTFIVRSDIEAIANFVRYYDFSVTLTVGVLSASLSGINYGYVATIPLSTGGIGNKTGGIVVPTLSGSELITTKTATFTGTGSVVLGGSTVTLSARPMPGYRLVKWLGSPCASTTENLGKVVPGSVDVNANNPCRFTITENVAVTALFDVGYYTLTILMSGDGCGRIYSDEDPTVNYENCNLFSSSTYKILSGTTLTLRASGYYGNRVLGLSSRFCNPIFDVDSCVMRFDRDETLIAILSTGKYYTLTVNLSTCGTLSVSSIPEGILGGIDCGATCQAIFPQGKFVRLTQLNPTETCYVDTFIGDGVYYGYSGGGGIAFTGGSQYFNGTLVTLLSSESFGLTDDSLTLGEGGAPYFSGEGVTVSLGDAFVLMTQDRSVSAITA
ncbi:hypothetical protein EBU95_06185 [bacterium]|nr:hypothetical protein [bacterium]